MKNRERGSVTVEAAIVFPIFIIAIFSLIMLIKFAFIHTIMQQGLSQMAKELSTYAYILDASRLTEVNAALTGTLGENVETLEQQVEAGTIWINMNQDYFKGEDIDKAEMEAANNNAMDVMQEIISDPTKLLKNMASVAALGAYEDGKRLIIKEVTKSMLPKFTGMDKDELGELFTLLGIKNGLEGVSIEGKFNDDHTVELVASYAVDLNPPLDIFLNELTLVQRAVAVTWTGDGRSYEPK